MSRFALWVCLGSTWLVAGCPLRQVGESADDDGRCPRSEGAAAGVWEGDYQMRGAVLCDRTAAGRMVLSLSQVGNSVSGTVTLGDWIDSGGGLCEVKRGPKELAVSGQYDGRSEISILLKEPGSSGWRLMMDGSIDGSSMAFRVFNPYGSAQGTLQRTSGGSAALACPSKDASGPAATGGSGGGSGRAPDAGVSGMEGKDANHGAGSNPDGLAGTGGGGGSASGGPGGGSGSGTGGSGGGAGNSNTGGSSGSSGGGGTSDAGAPQPLEPDAGPASDAEFDRDGPSSPEPDAASPVPTEDAAMAPDADSPPDSSPDADPNQCTVSSTRPPSTTSWGYCPGICEALWYDGQTHQTTYSLSFDPATALSVRWRARAALDDHDSVPVPYCLNITVNGVSAGTAIPTTPLEHGGPVGSVFENFRDFSYQLPAAARAALRTGSNDVSLRLGCAGGSGDWIVLHWSELEAVQAMCTSSGMDAGSAQDAHESACTSADGTIILTNATTSASYQTSIVAPGNGLQNYKVKTLDLRGFSGPGTLTITGTVGSVGSDASFDLLPQDVPFTCSGYPQGSLATAYDVSAGSSFSMSYDFDAGQILKLGSEGNWFSPQGSTNTVQITVSVAPR